MISHIFSSLLVMPDTKSSKNSNDKKHGREESVGGNASLRAIGSPVGRALSFRLDAAHRISTLHALRANCGHRSLDISSTNSRKHIGDGQRAANSSRIDKGSRDNDNTALCLRINFNIQKGIGLILLQTKYSRYPHQQIIPYHKPPQNQKHPDHQQ